MVLGNRIRPPREVLPSVESNTRKCLGGHDSDSSLWSGVEEIMQSIDAVDRDKAGNFGYRGWGRFAVMLVGCFWVAS